VIFRTDDTIVAISSAAGSAARAIVRLSGDDATQLAARLFHSYQVPLEQMGGFRVATGSVRLEARGIELPALAYVFRAPRSYTRQDVIELHIPGPAAAATALCEALIQAGARQAQAGEFTARAFFSGRIDLSQAQAVADVIEAAHDAQLRSAASALGGRVQRFCRRIASELTDILAGVEASIDFSAEDITLDEPAELSQRLARLGEQLIETARRARIMPETSDLPRVVLAGRVNAGKSSLLNAISRTDRAIISAMAGTTRDVLSATVQRPGTPAYLLQDAAGFAAPACSLATAAASAAKAAIAAADLLLFVVDISDDTGEQDAHVFEMVRAQNAAAPVLILANKIDLIDPDTAGLRARRLAERFGVPVLATSAKSAAGLEQVHRHVVECLELTVARGAEALGLHERQSRCMTAAGLAVQRAGQLLQGCQQVVDCAELAAEELRDAMAQLGAITGQLVSEEVLGRIFRRFCVGK